MIKNKLKRAVSPVIAIILMIALTVAASAIIWGISSDLFSVNKDVLVYERSGVSDANGDDMGDYIIVYLRNIGSEDSIIDSASLFRDNSELTSWVLLNTSYTIPSGSIDYIELQTVSTSDQVNSNNEVRITMQSSSTNSASEVDIPVPGTLSALPVIFAGGGFSGIDITAQGWVEYTYNTHGGGTGIYESNGDILFDTNDDMLFYLQNADYLVKNGIIVADFLYGDNDGIGIAFRIVDESNYYWVGFTEDHNGPANRAGENSNSFGGPWFNYDGRFEIHKLVNGVDTILGNAVTTGFTVTPGSANNPSGPYGFKISFSDNSFAFEVRYGTGNYEELFTVTDSQFADAGYFGVFSLAASGSRLNDFSVNA
ncbi:MAG: type IV pilin N-terminal domain-containing protein [Candidatus Heimdallarchaeota archaeon]|nr:type IV pilin N-terminal domain-containing protein [Candidatus Heimdallarchaeota archaeon]